MATANPYDAPRAPVGDLDDGATQDIKILGASGRLGRVRYIAYSFGLMVLLSILLGALAALLGFTVGADSILTYIILGIGYIAMMVIGVRLTIQRCHDFDMSGWLSLVMFVPLGVFAFWFVPGTAGANRWGPPTKPNSTGVVVLAVVVPLFFTVGILAAIAIPAYSDYQGKARRAAAFTPPPIDAPVPAQK